MNYYPPTVHIKLCLVPDDASGQDPSTNLGELEKTMQFVWVYKHTILKNE